MKNELITKTEAIAELNDSFCPPDQKSSFRNYNLKLATLIFGEMSEMSRDSYDDLYEEKVNAISL